MPFDNSSDRSSIFTLANNTGIFSLAIVSQIVTIAIFFRDLKRL